MISPISEPNLKTYFRKKQNKLWKTKTTYSQLHIESKFEFVEVENTIYSISTCCGMTVDEEMADTD